MSKDNNASLESNPSSDENDIKEVAKWVKEILLKSIYFEVQGEGNEPVLSLAMKASGEIEVALVPVTELEKGGIAFKCKMWKKSYPPSIGRILRQSDGSVSLAAHSDSLVMSTSQMREKTTNNKSLAASTSKDDNVFIIEGITGFSVVRVCTERLVEDPDKEIEAFPMLISHEAQDMDGTVSFTIPSRASEALGSKLFLVLLPTEK